eukprot:4726008-Alexandrium_andersonii.AAC.1
MDSLEVAQLQAAIDASLQDGNIGAEPAAPPGVPVAEPAPEPSSLERPEAAATLQAVLAAVAAVEARARDSTRGAGPPGPPPGPVPAAALPVRPEGISEADYQDFVRLHLQRRRARERFAQVLRRWRGGGAWAM